MSIPSQKSSSLTNQEKNQIYCWIHKLVKTLCSVSQKLKVFSFFSPKKEDIIAVSSPSFSQPESQNIFLADSKTTLLRNYQKKNIYTVLVCGKTHMKKTTSVLTKSWEKETKIEKYYFF